MTIISLSMPDQACGMNCLIPISLNRCETIFKQIPDQFKIVFVANQQQKEQ